MEKPTSQKVGLAPKSRALGTYICGNPGSGKSSLLLRNILWDIERGYGICVIDPTEQLIKILLGYIPKEHLDRVVYFNTSMGVPLNFFSCKDDSERQELSTDLTNIIDLSTAPVASKYLRRIIRAFFEANKNGMTPALTLWDIPRFLQDQKFIDTVLSKCAPERRENFPPLYRPPTDSINALLIRMSEITDSEVLRTVLGKTDAILNVSDMIEQKKIFLVDLEEDNPDDAIIGSIIAAKIQQTIWKRRHLADLYACDPYALYIDECDVILKFAEDRFKAILGRARKFKLYMTIACPVPSDLPEKIEKGLSKIGNLVIFNLDPSESKIFKSKIAPYDLDYLTNLEEYRALFRTKNKVNRVKTPKFLKPLDNGNAESVRDSTLREYGPEACNSKGNSHTSGNGNTQLPTSEAKDSDPKAEPIPDDTREASRASDAKRDVRNDRGRPGQNPKGQNS